MPSFVPVCRLNSWTGRFGRILSGAFLGIGLLCGSVASAFDSPDESLPNIVIIYADDLGYGDVGCYNPDRGKIPTPHIDQLAVEGMRFTDGHSSSGVCSPSRYTLLTGRYHWRTRLQRGIVGLWGAPLIDPDRLTIAGLLREKGYQTACVGKWHLGWDWPIEPAQRALFRGNKAEDVPASQAHRDAWSETFSQAIPGGPISRGFDHYFGTDVPNWPPFCFIEQDRTVGIPDEFLPAQLFRTNQASVQGPALADWTLEPILPELGRRACEYIRTAANREQPFFLYMPLTSPHTPLSVNDAWIGKSELNLYADFVMETDDVIGQVLKALDESGQADDTLVIFTSDNGCAPYIGVDELEAKGHFPSGPLRGYKSDVWEGGHRVPFIVRWPGRVRPSQVNHHLVHQADLLATCAEVVGRELAPNEGEDSFSLLSLLEEKEASPVRTHAVSQSSNGLLSVRSGDWKLIFGPGSGGWGKGSDEHPAQLYDLSNDLAESQNRYAQNPDKVAELTRLMERLVEQGRSTEGDTQTNDVNVNWSRFLQNR